LLILKTRNRQPTSAIEPPRLRFRALGEIGSALGLNGCSLLMMRSSTAGSIMSSGALYAPELARGEDGQAALDVHHARPRRLVAGDRPAAAYSSAPTTAASTGSISPAARKSGNTKPPRP
jgi:hypothetical protein